MSLHRRRVHPVPVEGCFGCRVSTIQVGARRHGQEGEYAYKSQWAAEFSNGDREAYRRLRLNGLQPPRIAGSAQLERHAETAFEVETGAVSRDQRGLASALSLCADSGIDPLKAATTPIVSED